MPAGTPNSKMTHREIFFAVNGLGPWLCYGCGSTVERGDLHVHHVDGDRCNDEIFNLVAMHNGCHMKMTNSGRTLTLEHRTKISAANRGRCWTTQQRTRFSRTLKSLYADGKLHQWGEGLKYSKSHRAAIRDGIRRSQQNGTWHAKAKFDSSIAQTPTLITLTNDVASQY
jgi:hypothetical protein